VADKAGQELLNMISPVSHSPANNHTPSQSTQNQAPPQKPQPKEDTVQISDAAKAASDGADHGADSH
jgi:hypothetical protein